MKTKYYQKPPENFNILLGKPASKEIRSKNDSGLEEHSLPSPNTNRKYYNT